MLITVVEGPAGGNYPGTVLEETKRRGMNTDFPYADEIADSARAAQMVRADFVYIGLGVLAGAAASIWSLIEAAGA